MSQIASEPSAPNGAPAATDGLLTTPNRTVGVGGDTFAYRRYGAPSATVPPLVMLQHFRGNLDSWDPALADRLAQDREIILMNNRGVGASTGEVPETVRAMARDALAFVDALALSQIDVLGFSLGGHVAQELTLLRPRLVRRLVLAGTAPRGGPGLHRWTDDVYALATPDQPTADDALGLFFSGSEHSVALGTAFLGRSYSRHDDRDAATDLATRDAQLAAITEWGIPDPAQLHRLSAITQPTLVATGDNDTMMLTENSRLLAQNLPNAQLRVYADAGHGFLSQYPELFADHVRAFLGR
jgi:pimeloyl-ACP methyl ester carboxylesterase